MSSPTSPTKSSTDETTSSMSRDEIESSQNEEDVSQRVLIKQGESSSEDDECHECAEEVTQSNMETKNDVKTEDVPKL